MQIQTQTAATTSAGNFELIQTQPPATGMAPHDLRGPAEVWLELIDSARERIDIAQFYAISRPGSKLDIVMAHLEQAAMRGVFIRFLMEKQGLRQSDEMTLGRLRQVPGLQFRLLDYGRISEGGILHAKYLVIDGVRAYSGSQNFDWRSLEQIIETGLRIDNAAVAGQLQAIFETDWHFARCLDAGVPVKVPAIRQAIPFVEYDAACVVAASPARFNPGGVTDSEKLLGEILEQAEKSVCVAVMEYAPLGQKGRYYGRIDQALREAAGRGVKVELLVSDWNLSAQKLPYLRSLAVLPNISLCVLTLPPDPSGFIPYARVLHSKIMTVDRRYAWVGSSNWCGGYMDKSRNVEILLRDQAVADSLESLFRQWWQSPHTEPLDVTRTYPPPHPEAP